ncbi:MAG: formylglycine-generating enzyme family protein [Anaerolineae bacterium]|jgi:serine/threonine-protein kinase|nr:formylglycine-generating enzyme family protein [Anaerolineae bacterium]
MSRIIKTKLLLILIVMLFLVSCTQSAADEEVNVREKDGMEMVYVPEGTFIMGTSEEQKAWILDQDWCADCKKYMIEPEIPQQEVYLDAYWIDKYEVTNAQYALCVDDGACDEPLLLSSPTHEDYYGKRKYADYPVMYVTFPQAKHYCEWAGGILPTEAQWEKAANGTDGRLFPWGEALPTCELANFKYDGEPCIGDTARVGKYPEGASPYGAMDMAGNVTEWVMDSAEREVCHYHRGGDWNVDTFNIRTHRRLCTESNILTKNYSIGFRCIMAP